MASQFASANEQYVSTFDKGHLPLPPAKGLIVVTCMDARIEHPLTFFYFSCWPLAQLGLNLGESHVIRNAGGSAKESLRSIVVSQRLLGTREIAVFRHTDCGMLTFKNEQLQEQVISEAPGNAEVAKAVNTIDFLAIANLEENLKADIQFVQSNPLVLPGTTVTGWIYDVTTGKIKKIV